MSNFADLRAELDRAAPVGRVPRASSPTGGVAVGMGNLSLAEQGAALPGTPVGNSRSVPSPKVYFPVVIKGAEKMCLAVIGQGLSFCLRTSCPVVAHRDS